jgi:hypothetical protein
MSVEVRQMAARFFALVAVVLAASLLAFAPAQAVAEEGAPGSCSDGVVCLPPVDVVGTVRQPMVFVIDRGRLEIRPVRAEESFTREIVRSLDHAPF